MNKTSQDTLSAIERSVKELGVSIKIALDTAYHLGKLDGGIEAVAVGLREPGEIA